MTSDKSRNTRDLDARIWSLAQEAARRAGMSPEAWIRVAMDRQADGDAPRGGEGTGEERDETAELLAHLGDRVRAMSMPQRRRGPSHQAELDQIIRRIARDLQDVDETARAVIESPPAGTVFDRDDPLAETLRDIEDQVSALADRAGRRSAGEDERPDTLHRGRPAPPIERKYRTRGAGEAAGAPGREPRAAPRPAPEARRADPPRRPAPDPRRAEPPPPPAPPTDPLSVAIADIARRQSFLSGRPAPPRDTTPGRIAALRADIDTLSERIAALTDQAAEGRGERLRTEQAALAGEASMATIAATLGEIRSAIDGLAAPQRRAAAAEEIAAVVVGLDELRSKVEAFEKTGRQGADTLRRLETRVESLAQVDPAALVRGVEERIDRLAAQVDEAIRAPARAKVVDALRSEIASIRLEAVARGNRNMEAMEQRVAELVAQLGAAPRTEETDQLAALEARVENLVADLAALAPNAAALERVEARVDRLRRSLAEEREEAVEAARAAAQEAVRDLEPGGATRDLAAELRRDLEEVRGLLAATSRNAGLDERAMHEKLAAVASRIESLADAGDFASAHGREADEPPAWRGKRDLGLVREVASTAPPDERQPPGRRADFISAARRAVQGAMEQSLGPARGDDDAPGAFASADGSSPFARIGQAIRSRRRSLLLAAAALVLAIGALQVFSRPTAVAQAESGPGAVIVERPYGAMAGVGVIAEDDLPIPPTGDSAAVARAVGPVDPFTTGSTAPEGTAPGIGPRELREAAAAGDPVAIYEIANLYADGRGTLRDLAQAAQWYRRAADAGMVPAIFRLASLYERGQGVPRDLPRAMGLYQRAAQQGNPGAMYNLAVLLNAGVVGPADPAQALGWFRAAAEHGVKDSQYNLGIIYSRGLGVPVDLGEAYKWFAVAAGAGDRDAAAQRDQAARVLDANQLSVAKAAASAFRPRTPPRGAEDTVAPVPTTYAAAPPSPVPALTVPEDATPAESREALVRTVQTLLAERGYDPGPVDGLAGPKTVEAVRAFQRSVGVASTGRIDGALVTKLSQRTG